MQFSQYLISLFEWFTALDSSPIAWLLLLPISRMAIYPGMHGFYEGDAASSFIAPLLARFFPLSSSAVALWGVVFTKHGFYYIIYHFWRSDAVIKT